MMLTEAEAVTKWCPLSRVMSTNGQGGGNRWDQSGAPSTSPNGSTCIGSACMAWRVGQAARPAYPGEIHGRMVNSEGPPTTYYKAGTERPEQPEKGFCGQFGVPR